MYKCTSSYLETNARDCKGPCQLGLVISPSYKNVGSWLCQHGDNSSSRRRSIVCRASHPYYTQIVKTCLKRTLPKGRHQFYIQAIIYILSIAIFCCFIFHAVAFKKFFSRRSVRLVSLIEYRGVWQYSCSTCATVCNIYEAMTRLWHSMTRLWHSMTVRSQ